MLSKISSEYVFFNMGIKLRQNSLKVKYGRQFGLAVQQITPTPQSLGVHVVLGKGKGEIGLSSAYHLK